MVISDPVFVKSFISAFIKRLVVYYITAKGKRLTAEALKKSESGFQKIPYK